MCKESASCENIYCYTVLGFDMRSQQPMLAMFMPQNFQRCEFHLSAIFLFLSMHSHWSHVKTKSRMIPNQVWETAIQFTVLMYGYICYRSKWFLGYSTFKLVYCFFQTWSICFNLDQFGTEKNSGHSLQVTGHCLLAIIQKVSYPNIH